MFKLIIFIMAILTVQKSFSKSQVKDIFFQENKNGKFHFTIVSDGDIKPDVDVIAKDNLLQVEIPNSIVWPKITKKITLNKKEIQLTAYQFDKKTVRVRAIYPKGERLRISDYKKNRQRNNIHFSGVISFNNEPEGKTDVAKYDESYLNKLIKEKEVIKKKVVSDKKMINLKKDTVNLRYSSPQKNKKESSFNVWRYAAKFLGLLCLMVGGIYGAFVFLKKGALKKSKISFLNPDRQIEIVTKHALSPKRSLNLIRVNKQVFLIANHENGIEFLSEVNDPGDVLRDAEKEFTGASFEESLEENSQKNNTDIQIKEDINISTPVENEISIANRVKNKLKNIRDIQ